MRRAAGEQFDAIVLDLMLPGISGMELLATVREKRPEVPVVILTARSDISDRIAGLDAGAVDYVQKPFSVRSSRRACGLTFARCCKVPPQSSRALMWS